MNSGKIVKQECGNLIEEKCTQTGAVINRYTKGRRLGKGGFAVCHEVVNQKTGRRGAVKIIDKSTLTKAKAKQKLASEIKIHSQIRSQYVVGFQHFFQDSQFVYIILELCENQTLNELVKRRKRLTELEVKYYMHQLILATKDIHEQNVIHRDLKLGNLLLTDKLEIRVGDFGLAAKVASKSQRRKTMCGTPNYIAPQILDNINGHSFQVDIWSLGVIAYALAVGRPPFETSDVKTTYTKIKNCNYSYPEDASVSDYCKSFISKMLQRDPRHRATVQELLNDQFFTMAPFPLSLPMSTLACPPNSNFIKQYQPVPMTKRCSGDSSNSQTQTLTNQAQRTQRGLSRVASRRTIIRANSTDKIQNLQVKRAASTAGLMKNPGLVTKVQTRLNQRNKYGPFVWVVYCEENPKFGMSYMLNSNAVGMRYNDSTCLVSNSEFTAFKYHDTIASRLNPTIKQKIYTVQMLSAQLAKKYKIIDYYKKQLKEKKQEDETKMCNQQIIMKERLRFRETPETMMQVYVTKYFKNLNITIFWFNNKDRQIIFKDSTQLLFTKNHVTYVNKVGVRKYFDLEQLQNQPEEVKKRMRYLNTCVEGFWEMNNMGHLKQPNSNHQDSNKENKLVNGNGNQPVVTKRQSASLASQSQSKMMMRSASMQKIEKVEKPRSILMMKGSASSNRLAPYKYQ